MSRSTPPSRLACYFFLDDVDFFADSFTVVLGLCFTVDCLTNLPVMALRPRLPLVAMSYLLPREYGQGFQLVTAAGTCQLHGRRGCSSGGTK